MAATAPPKTMTADELLHLPTGMGARYELVEGELITLAPAGMRHGGIALHIGALLQQFVRENRLGRVVGAETGFILHRNPDTVRAPDAAYITRARVPPGGLPDGYFPGAPDLAVEVVSPSDTAAEVQQKADEYLRSGAQQVWVVYPDQRRVAVFVSTHQVQLLSDTDSLDGGALLPGFTCPVSELFE